MLFGGGPQQLGMFAQQGEGGAQPGLLDRFEQRMNNPLVAAALGAGGAMLGSQGNLGQAIQAGVLGGAGGAYGTARMNRQRQKDMDRQKIMEKLLERYANVANQAPQQQQLQLQQQPGPMFPSGGLF